jgi:hypothetical protein
LKASAEKLGRDVWLEAERLRTLTEEEVLFTSIPF